MERLRQAIAGRVRTEHSLARELLAEFSGTFFLLLIGVSANIQASFASLSIAQGNALAAALGAQLAWGFGFAFAVYMSAQISGAHLNPSISLCALLHGQISAARFVLYLPAQLVGAFLGSALAFLGHLEDCQSIRDLRGDHAFAAQFATYPRQGLSLCGSIADQLIGTAILSAMVCLITDKRHRVPAGLVPLLAGLTMTMIALTFGNNGGFAINPARDLGPRLFVLCLGLGWEVFSNNNFYFWIPLAVPFAGALLGAWIYKLMIGVHGLDEQIEISGAKYPRDDRGYKEYSSNPASIGPGEQLVGFSPARLG